MDPGPVTGAYAVTAGLLFGLSLYGLLVRRELLRRLMAANVMASSVFLYLIVLAVRTGNGVPDPVPQAMVLTGIVIAVAVTAYALGLARRLQVEDEEGNSGQPAARDSDVGE